MTPAQELALKISADLAGETMLVAGEALAILVGMYIHMGCEIRGGENTAKERRRIAAKFLAMIMQHELDVGFADHDPMFTGRMQ